MPIRDPDFTLCLGGVGYAWRFGPMWVERAEVPRRNVNGTEPYVQVPRRHRSGCRPGGSPGQHRGRAEGRRLLDGTRLRGHPAGAAVTQGRPRGAPGGRRHGDLEREGDAQPQNRLDAPPQSGSDSSRAAASSATLVVTGRPAAVSTHPETRTPAGAVRDEPSPFGRALLPARGGCARRCRSRLASAWSRSSSSCAARWPNAWAGAYGWHEGRAIVCLLSLGTSKSEPPGGSKGPGRAVDR